ncbi:MAG: HYR domain-containing protein [Acidobacteriota bacterium]
MKLFVAQSKRFRLLFCCSIIVLFMLTVVGVYHTRRVSAAGTISLTTLGSPYTQDFNTLSNTAGSTTNNLTINGWAMTESGGGARDNEQYAVDTGGSNTGDTYSYGAAGNTERALGELRSGTLIPLFGASFTNNTGATITSLQVAFTGEQWRLGTASRTDQLNFEYSTNATDLTTGTWTNVSALNFVTPNTVTTGAKDGNAAGNRTALNSTITGLSIANGATFWIRWTDTDASSADDGLAVDDFSLTPNGGVALPNLTINDVTLAEGNSGTTTFTFTVSLSAPAGAGGVTFDIATADGTAQDGNPISEDNDYVANSLTGQTIPAGSSTYTFSVTVNGDTTPEPNETFFVNVTNVTGANVADGQGQGTINNDDVILIPIHDIQGPGASSPIVGSSITTRGIVTGVKSNGFFIQEPDAMVDADPATSEGIFVFTSSAPPAAAAVGNNVQVTATVSEFVPSADPLQPPLTELTAPTVSLLSSGNPLPAPIPLTATFPDPAGVHDQLERLEGMRVSVASLTVVGPTGGNISEVNATSTSTGVFFGVVTGVARPFREAGIQAPDPPPAGTIPPIPRFDANPERIRVDSDGLTGGPVIDVGTGAVVTGLVGPLDYSFRTYTILPDPGASVGVMGGPTPTAVTAPVAAEFTVASFNLERFFDNVNDPAIGEPTLTTTAFNNRLNKASLAIRDFLRLPDIIGIEEIENLTTLQTLAARISTDAIAASQPDPQYVGYLIEGNDVGGIDVGFLVKTAPVSGMTPRVSVIEVLQELDGTLFVNPDSSTETLNDRPPLRLSAIINYANGTTYPVTVIVNHLRSLNGVDGVGTGSNGWATEGDRVRAKRLKQAEDLANLVQARQVANPNEHIILVGDFNAFEVNDGFVDSLSVIAGTPVPDNQTAVPGDGVDLVNPDFVNLFNTPPASERYSFIFDGNAQSLDHILVNAPLISSTTARREEHPRIDSDFPETARNDANSPTRLSDHDPVVAYFTVTQNQPPVAQCQNVTVSAGPSCTADASINNGSFDPDMGDMITVSQSPAGPYPKGVTTVTLTVTDSHNLSTSCTATVTVNDTTPPTLSCPANITTDAAPGLCSAVVNYAVPVATDNCSGGGTVTCSPAAGSSFAKGITTVSCSVQDSSGNSASCSFTVTVNDTQPPSLSCPTNITASAQTAQCTAVVNYTTPTASDNCPGATTICTPASGSSFPQGTTTVTCTATDASLNTASCSFTVTVNDTQAPSLTCPANITAVVPSGCPVASATIVNYVTPVATDTCSPATTVCSPPSGSMFAVGTTIVTCTATDASGNSASCSFSVTVYSGCLQDNSNSGNVVLFNHLTGAYKFCCNGTVIASGNGVIQLRGCTVTIQHNTTTKRVLIQFDASQQKGSASVQSPIGTTACTIIDSNTANNNCNCQ